MPLELAEFAKAIRPNSRLIALDVGTKTIGVALSDRAWQIGSPLKTIERGKLSVALAELQAIIKEQDVSGIAVGWPLNMDGSEGPRCQATRAFVRESEAVLKLPFLFWDERLSTVAVERTMLDADLSRARRKEVVDKMAASFMLQGVLDRLRNL
ncbi:Holliday junction resolvase RuvX [bacterium]|nr:Holliday junction resolvase RuvX [bacterium]